MAGFLLVCSAPTTSTAQSKAGAGGDAVSRAEADRLGKEGERLLEKHDAQAAIDPLARAYGLTSNPRFLLPLGLAYAEADRPLDALDALGRFLKDSPSVPDAKRKEIGAKFAVMLDQVAALVTLESTRQNAPVKVDGRPLGTTPIQTPLRMMPGKHEIVMQPAPTDPSSGSRVVIEVKPGERRTVKLEPGAPSRFLDPQAHSTLPASEETAMSGALSPLPSTRAGSEAPIYSKWWFWTAIGSGAATVLAVGLGAGLGTRHGSGPGTVVDESASFPSWPGGTIDARQGALIALSGFAR